MEDKDLSNIKYKPANGIEIPALGLGTWQVPNDISARVVLIPKSVAKVMLGVSAGMVLS
jgi:diketogulonate reductase-like aldo/keto reductase